jgi:hypothetical protein
MSATQTEAQTAPEPLEEALIRAITSCAHSIDAETVTLQFDPSKPGHNALNQLQRRVSAVIAERASPAWQVYELPAHFWDDKDAAPATLAEVPSEPISQERAFQLAQRVTGPYSHQPSLFGEQIVKFARLVERSLAAGPAPVVQAVREPLPAAEILINDFRNAVASAASNGSRTVSIHRKVADALLDVLGMRSALAAVAEPAEQTATPDQLIELTAHLERGRAKAIVEAVTALDMGGASADMPTPFQAGYQGACEEIAHRLKTEAWGITPGCGWGPTGAANEDDRPSPEFASLLRKVLAATPTAAAGERELDMRAVCDALGFDPTNHHNAAKCPYCRPTLKAAEPNPPAQGVNTDEGQASLNAAAIATSRLPQAEPVSVHSSSTVVVEILPTRIWVESDLLGARHVVLQHEGMEAFTYASFHYRYGYTDNSGTYAAAEALATQLGAAQPIEHRTRDMKLVAAASAKPSSESGAAELARLFIAEDEAAMSNVGTLMSRGRRLADAVLAAPADYDLQVAEELAWQRGKEAGLKEAESAANANANAQAITDDESQTPDASQVDPT